MALPSRAIFSLFGTSPLKNDASAMKILLHDYGNYPFTRQLARELVARGHFVNYVFSESTQLIKRGGVEQGEGRFSITAIRLERTYAKYNYLQRRACEIEHGNRLADLVKQERPDIVLSANTPLDAQSLIWRASRDVGAKFVYWMQDAIGMATSQGLKHKLPVLGALVGGYYTACEKSLVRKSDHVVVISEDFQALMKSWRIGKEQFTLIPNWAPLDELPVELKNNEWSKEHHLADKFCFLYTGILGLKHSPALFLNLAEAFKNRLDARIVIISEGESVRDLAREAEMKGINNLILMPSQPSEVYAQVLGAADVLMAILNEDAGRYSAPSKVLSYLCAGRPLLLAIPVGNPSARIVDDHGCGLVCSPKDVDQLIANATQLYEDKALAAEMGKKSRRYAEETFNCAAITDRFEHIFTKICPKHK
jgi:glycosyltransferase involved in cell wall biosynthesis